MLTDSGSQEHIRPTSEMARLFYMGTIHIDANRPQVEDDLQIIFKIPWGHNKTII